MSESDETDTGDADAVDKLRRERLGKHLRQDVGFDAEVDEDPAVDDASNRRDLHAADAMATPPESGAWVLKCFWPRNLVDAGLEAPVSWG